MADEATITAIRGALSRNRADHLAGSRRNYSSISSLRAIFPRLFARRHFLGDESNHQTSLLVQIEEMGYPSCVLSSCGAVFVSVSNDAKSYPHGELCGEVRSLFLLSHPIL